MAWSTRVPALPSDTFTNQDQIFTSLPFRFIVGGKSFYVHRELVSQYSKPLASMINNGMLEGQQGFATLEDVDQGTLTRFIEWLYRGYYHAATPKQVPKPEQPSENSDGLKAQKSSSTSSTFSFGDPKPTFSGIDATEALQGMISAPTTSEPTRRFFVPAASHAAPPTAERPGSLSFGTIPRAERPGSLSFGPTPTAPRTAQPYTGLFGGAPLAAPPTAEPPRGLLATTAGATQALQSSSNGSETSGDEPAKELFIRRKYNIRQTMMSMPLPRKQSTFKPEQEDFSEVFLCHAYLHVFADKYDIQTLKVLALEELHATLAVFTLYQERTGDILNLLRYVYKEAPEQRNKMEDLRTLMTQYVESEFGTLVKDEALGTYLMETNGEFLEDFLVILRKRLA
ncbi:MAG: hypothetical protein Q9195_003030 [Heterodermia aff. obscurata]